MISLCEYSLFGLAALSRRLVSLFFRHALVLAVVLHRDALLLVACLHRLSFSSGSDTLFNLASDEIVFRHIFLRPARLGTAWIGPFWLGSAHYDSARLVLARWRVVSFTYALFYVPAGIALFGFAFGFVFAV
jgi:hypothetical protein